MDIRPGISPAKVKYLTLARNDVFKFFGKNYQIVLHKRVRLIAVPDDEVFAAVLEKDFKHTRAVAQKKAKNFSGEAKELKDQYILVLKAEESRSNVSIMRTTCHEMVHWYQLQEAGLQRTNQYRWILEGSATVMALHLVEPHFNGDFDKYRRGCLKTLKKASQIPSLPELNSRKDWQAAVDKYSSAIVYDKAVLAVMDLAQRAGINSLFNYVMQLKRQPHAKAFETAFNLNLQEFEREMDGKFSK